MTGTRQASSAPGLPGWVPEGVRHYLAHTVAGQSIRALARQSDLHPSTVLRQVRRFEARRDDPLVDDALRALSPTMEQKQGTRDMLEDVDGYEGETSLSRAEIEAAALPILRRLCEQGAILAVAREMDTAVVVRDGEGGTSLRTASVGREVAQAMALQSWIETDAPEARVVRYAITQTGRTAMRELTAQSENRAQGFRDVAATGGAQILSLTDPGGSARFVPQESPLMGLARRRDKDGSPFLPSDLVHAGERLREDWELSYIKPHLAEDWAKLLARKPPADMAPATAAARARVHGALTALGPGLSDVALHCCCLLNGLEATEKTFGWSARSGKVVLRIALQRLHQHYEEQGKFGPLIG